MNPSTPDIRNPHCPCNGPGCPDCSFEVASPECFSTAQPDTTGMAIAASVDVPEEIKFAGEGFRELDNSARCTGDRAVVTSPTIQPLTDGVIYDEHLALALDEGQNSSNAWRLHDHVNHGLEVLVKRVDGVLIRAKVLPCDPAEDARLA